MVNITDRYLPQLAPDAKYFFCRMIFNGFENTNDPIQHFIFIQNCVNCLIGLSVQSYINLLRNVATSRPLKTQ